MNKEETELIKNLIIDQINSTEKEIIELIELTKPISLDASIGRVSRMDAINNKTINEKALRDKKSILQKLERAKERSEKGELGKCLKCGGEIPFGRLKIMPYTTRCVKCA
ncbi:MAG: TraR/DksA C4-type zinc finger protein [Balneolaceae bacterium]